jgi:hypothetical protein
MRAAILIGAATLSLCSIAFAQTASQQNADNPASTNPGGIHSKIEGMLRNEGFTDIRMMPSSFMIRAKDKDGNPVVMMVSPDSLTEITAVGNSGANNGLGNTPSETPTNDTQR